MAMHGTVLTLPQMKWQGADTFSKVFLLDLFKLPIHLSYLDFSPAPLGEGDDYSFGSFK